MFPQRSVHQRRPARRECRRLALEILEARDLPAGTWTALANLVPSPTGTSVMMLLTDGTVMVEGGDVANTWYKLTPAANGDYVQGTWSQLASMHIQRWLAPSNVLPDGRVFILGGEYSLGGDYVGPAGSQNENNTGEIYDPRTNTWTLTANYPQSEFGDDPTEVLPNGDILAGSQLGPDTYFYHPATNTWSPAALKLRHDPSSEEGWMKLADGSILTYDIGASGATGVAERYLPATNTWVNAGTVPVQLSSFYELGPSVLLADGRALLFGDNGTSAYYTPSTNTWTAGPVIPNHLAADDVPGAMLPNGHVLLTTGNSPRNGGVFGPATLYEFDPTANTYTNVTPDPRIIDTTGPGFVIENMLVLPSGQVLFNNSGNQLAVYTPAGTPDPAWKPTITSIVSNGGLTYTLTGTQLNGLSEGAAYGDDIEMATNYPIVRLTNTAGSVYTARTFNWTSLVATGSMPVTTQFTLSTGLPVGSYALTVVANGIASAPVNFTAPLAVLSSTPADGSSVSTPPTSFSIHFNEPVNPQGIPSSALQVNGVGADQVTLDGSGTTATFTYLNSPVNAEGAQSLTIAAGTITGQDGSRNTALNASFSYDAVMLAVTSTNPAAGGVITLRHHAMLNFDVHFNEAIDPATAAPTNLVLSQGTVTGATALPGGRAIRYTIARLTDGPLTVSIPAGQVEDAFDNPDFTPFHGSYTVDVRTPLSLTPLAAAAPAGSLAYQASDSDLIGFAGDRDKYLVAADPGQTITVLVTTPYQGQLQPTIQLVDPSGTPLGSATAAAAGQAALLQTVATTTGGTYLVRVGGAGGTTGSYTIQVDLNAAVEASSQGIGSDGTPATAQDLDPSFLGVQTSLAAAGQVAVLGSVGLAPVTLNAVFSGWWDSTGYHDPTNLNYIVGQFNSPPLTMWHDFLVFDLSGITHPITGARLNLTNPANGYVSDFSSDTYSLFDVSTPILALESPGSGQVGIFNDLGSGTSYGSMTVSQANNNRVISIPLDAVALTALNGNVGSLFAVGGAITSLMGTHTQLLFRNTGGSSDTKQLVLTFTDTPQHYYSFTLGAGERATVALKNLTGSGDTIAIQDAAGNTLATGQNSAANLDQEISNFAAPADGTYYVVLTDSNAAATYDLVVTRDAAFDTKPNTTFATAQDVTGTQGVVGALTATAGAVVPAVYANQETFNGNAYPFAYVTSMRYQQIYAASDLGTGGLIDAIRFRRSSGQAVFTSMPIDISISLSYAATTVATASAVFADNIGAGGLVNVYRGPLVLASTAANSSPQAFDVVINLMQDFTYDPSQGSLLLDITVTGATGNMFFLEATPSGATTTTRIYAFDVNEPVGQVGLTAASPGPYGLVTRFDYVAPPPPDWYKVTLAAGQTALQAETSTPLGGPNQVRNMLYPAIQLFDAAGNLITSGTLLGDGRNQSFLATGLTAGATYYVEVTSANGSSGEYFLGVTPLLTPAVGRTVDDAGRGFRTHGPGWTVIQGSGYGGSEHSHPAVAGGTDFAQWKYHTNVTAGSSYAIYVSWTADPGNATNATYEIDEDGVLLATVTVDQTRSPNTGLIENTLVQLLYVYTPATTGVHIIRIRLSDNANGTVVADAIFDPPLAAAEPARRTPLWRLPPDAWFAPAQVSVVPDSDVLPRVAASSRAGEAFVPAAAPSLPEPLALDRVFAAIVPQLTADGDPVATALDIDVLA